MSQNWTTEQVLSLSPDESSTKNGKKLASLTKWQNLGRSEGALWGECKGSGADPYKTQIDLSEPAFNCSCPSRKFPCKHALGLFLLLAANPDSIPVTDPPTWVAEWIEKRMQKQQAKAEKKAAPKDPVAQAKRAAQRENKVQAGIADLSLWLQDLVREGLAAVQSQSYTFWETPAARLVDAQAPGLARQIREMAGIPYSGGLHWPDQLLERLGSLYLVLEGYQRLETLPPGTQADLRTVIGWTQKQEELLNDETVPTQRDQWLILGKRIVEEDQLKIQRVWLWGQTHQRLALGLSFSVMNQPLDVSLVPGTCLDADLVFFPSAYPLRALVKTRHASPEAIPAFAGFETIALALSAWQQALAQQPWITTFPFPLLNVHVLPSENQWFVMDQSGDSLPISPNFEKAWELLALAGGHPVDLCGEWDAQIFVPLSVFAEGRFWPLN